MTRSFPLFIALVLVGCSKAPDAPPAPSPTTAGHGDHEKSAAHGGVMVEIGEDEYHAEAVFEAGGTVRLYLLGRDAKKVIEIDAKPVEAFAKPDGGTTATRFEFTPEPQPDDTLGKTSRLVGKLPADTVGKGVGVSVPNLRVGADRYRVAFHSPEGTAHDVMPAKRPDDEADKLFLTPGGAYTAADVKANGNTVPAVKFKGIKAKHDIEPKPGDKVCPVSDTLANPQFTWIVGGKSYEFCCPPCVEEFVAAAKEKPDGVKPPEAYRKK